MSANKALAKCVSATSRPVVSSKRVVARSDPTINRTIFRILITHRARSTPDARIASSHLSTNASLGATLVVVVAAAYNRSHAAAHAAQSLHPSPKYTKALHDASSTITPSLAFAYASLTAAFARLTSRAPRRNRCAVAVAVAVALCAALRSRASRALSISARCVDGSSFRRPPSEMCRFFVVDPSNTGAIRSRVYQTVSIEIHNRRPRATRRAPRDVGASARRAPTRRRASTRDSRASRARARECRRNDATQSSLADASAARAAMASRATTRDVDDGGVLFPRCVTPTRSRARARRRATTTR
jgi:hypothetical protein